MPTDFDELKRQLLQTDEEYRQLATSASRSRREVTHPGRTKLPLGTGTARRSHPQETKTPLEGSDGRHRPPPPRPRSRRPPRWRGAERPTTTASWWPDAPRQMRASGLRFFRPAAFHENRSRGVSVHRRRAGAGARPGRSHGGAAWALPFAALGGFFAYFFRDPDRTVPPDPGHRGVAGRRQGDDCRPERRPLGPARATGTRSRSSCPRWTCT